MKQARTTGSRASGEINALCYYADDAYLEMLNISGVPGAPSRYDPSDSEPERPPDE